MSLLQDVLRSHIDNLGERLALASLHRRPPPADDSDDEWINVVSLPGTPARSRTTSRPTSRPPSPSPTTGCAFAPLSPFRSRDPLKVLPTEISQRIFSLLSVLDLSRCARVSRKWYKSQTLNYVWFTHFRKGLLYDDGSFPGTWSKRESKQNWRMLYAQINVHRSPVPNCASSPSSPSSPASSSGRQTPKELREEKWHVEAMSRPGKVEMRAMYKELGGRKARSKTKLGSTGIRDKGGWDDPGTGW